MDVIKVSDWDCMHWLRLYALEQLSRYYRFESADILCEQFNKFVNTLKKEIEEMKEK